MSQFANWVAADVGSPYPPAPGRYHLYVSRFCPFASRAVTVRSLKGLDDVIGMSVTDPVRHESGWAFRLVPGATLDPINGWNHLAEGYEATDPDYDSRVTVPVLWDVERGEIVSNDSGDIAVMLNDVFDEWAEEPDLDMYPVELRPQIDELNDWIAEDLNKGVYRAGYARTQEAYDVAVRTVFDALDRLDAMLADSRYLLGARHTLSDWRLFPTLIRFDLVYHGHFRCNLRRIVDYPNLWPYLRDLYQTPRVAGTVDFDAIRRGYHCSESPLNAGQIVPIGPELDFLAPHDRAAIGTRS
ncbi:MAG TPA: glutathione S-transferase C-terminal domain-containing protein [Thermoleophilaceae bacterium]